MSKKEFNLVSIKTFIYGLIAFSICYQAYNGSPLNVNVFILYIFFSIGTIYILLCDYSIQKTISKLWIILTFLTLPSLIIAINLYGLIAGSEKSWRTDSDRIAIIYVYSIPLIIGVFSFILTSKYLKKGHKHFIQKE